MSLTAKAGRGRETRWTREAVIEKIREWHSLYGEPPRAADWNPSSAKWSGQTWRIARYEAGDWPSLNAAKRPFGGSLNAAVEAAGFQAARPGPPAYRKEAEPELDTHLDAHPLVKAALGAARSEVSDLERKLEVRDRQLSEARRVRDRLKGELAAARSERRPARTVTKTKTKTKVKVVKERDLASLKAAKAQTKEARLSATRAAAKLERAEATVNAVRAERAELKAEIARLSNRAYEAERRLRAAEGEVKEVEVVRDVVREVEVVREVPAPEQAVLDAALKESREARGRADSADRRADRAERAYLEIAAAVKGEARRLSPAEMKELRDRGPSGPAVLAAALKEVAKARSGNGDLRAALTLVASAAMTWKDRLG